MRSDRRSLGWLCAIAAAAIVWLAKPFIAALVLGTLLAFMVEPLYLWLTKHRLKPSAASVAIVLTSAAIIVVSLATFVSLFITRAIQFAAAVRDQLRGGGPLENHLQTLNSWLARVGISLSSLNERLQAAAGAIASSLAGMAGTLASGTFSFILNLLFAMLAMHLVLRNWPRIVKLSIRISPLPERYTEALLSEFRNVGRMTILGTIITGLAQGVLAAIGFWISGVPQPLFFGMATAVASLIPAVGTLLVWVPAALYLLSESRPAFAIVDLLWGALVVVGFSDYVIRPRLVGAAEMPALIVFVALFGGVEAFGLPGLIMGPILMALAVAALRLYAREQDGEHPDRQ